jgi:uncharacterized membrane protein SpoIIM required for sporulation
MLLRREDFLVFAVAQNSGTQRAQRIAHRAHREEKTVCFSFSVISVGSLFVASVLEAFGCGFAALSYSE